MKKLNKALIISPTGGPMWFDEQYDTHNHWRYTKENREYETWVVNYNGYEIAPGTYDKEIGGFSGLKWDIILDVAKNYDLTAYDYIGCWDDDYATDIQSVNRCLEIARSMDMKWFQPSMTSWTVYPCLEQNKEWVFSETNFTELGVPFFRQDIFYKVMRFMSDYKYAYTRSADWGQDKVLHYYLRSPAYVIHEVSAKHMRPDSSTYDKSKAFQDMHYIMNTFMPDYMKQYGIDYVPTDVQQTLRAWTKQ